MRCPLCGAPMARTASHAHSAPWLCAPCKRAWWEAELTKEARARFRPSVRDFGHDPTIRKAVERERERALIRSKGAT